MKKSAIIYTVIAGIILSCFIFIVIEYEGKLNKKDNRVVVSESSKISYELDLVREDLKTYGYLSNNVIDQYVEAIRMSNKEDNVPIGLLHAIIRIESDYRFWIEHSLVTTKVSGKMKEVRAVGCGGIIWELWKDSLEVHGRASQRSDLFLPYQSVRSISLVLKILIKDEYRKGNNNLVNRVLIRYYGAYDKDYYDKTIKVTSDLWLKRMNLFLKQNF